MYFLYTNVSFYNSVFLWKLKLEIKKNNPEKHDISSHLAVTGKALDDCII